MKTLSLQLYFAEVIHRNEERNDMPFLNIFKTFNNFSIF